MKLSKRIALIFASLLMVLCVSVSVSAKESPTKQSFKASLNYFKLLYLKIIQRNNWMEHIGYLEIPGMVPGSQAFCPMK